VDPITLIFYASVCGALGWASPKLGTPVTRLVIGAAVGIVAATALPYLRSLLGL